MTGMKRREQDMGEEEGAREETMMKEGQGKERQKAENLMRK